MKIPVRIHVGRGSDGLIRFYIVDDNANISFCEVIMTPTEFAEAFTGLSTKAVADVRGLNMVGKIREHKSVRLPLAELESTGFANRTEDAKRFLKPYEVDGWQGSAVDVNNHHNRSGDSVTVGFERWVDKSE